MALKHLAPKHMALKHLAPKHLAPKHLAPKHLALKPAARLRKICLALPDAAEVVMRRGPSYRVAGKIFAVERPHAGATALWCKVPPGSQQVLTGADPRRFFVPPYFGPKGWVGVVLDARVNWKEVAALVERSYRLVAPKRKHRL